MYFDSVSSDSSNEFVFVSFCEGYRSKDVANVLFILQLVNEPNLIQNTLKGDTVSTY